MHIIVRVLTGLGSLVLLTSLTSLTSLGAEEPAAAVAPPAGLVGLWHATARSGPDVRGTLTIERRGETWRAEIAGRQGAVRVEGDQLRFELPGDEGSFRGRLEKNRIVGHWIQPRTVAEGTPYATPVVLAPLVGGRWRGTVEPHEDEMNWYLPISRSPDGTLRTTVRNPERNAGLFISRGGQGAARVEFDGQRVKLLGQEAKDAPETILAEGPFEAEPASFSLRLRGVTLDFTRASAAEEVRFAPPARAAALRPAAEEDGWPTATLEEVGIARGPIEAFLQMVSATPVDAPDAVDLQGVLLARHGKLVLEEYFHGFHREQLHDTRSAAKSLAAVLTGAAILHGYPVDASTSVYEAMESPEAFRTLSDPRQKALEVRHLLTMTSGLDCDDNDPDSPGREDRIAEQTAQPDWYRYTLDLKMVRDPGEASIYCSCNPNLLGGVLARKTRHWLPDLFRELVAEPMQFGRYALPLTPTGEAYMGGGARFRPRDFMKLGQVLLDGGRWRGRQILSADWARQAVEPSVEPKGSGLHYGYLWWVTDYAYQGRTLRAFFAAGNGGQIVLAIPQLDVVIAFFGGNYSQRAGRTAQRVFVPQYFLPALPAVK